MSNSLINRQRRLQQAAAAALLSALLAGAGLPVQAAAPVTSAQQEVRVEIGKFLQPAQQAIKEQRFTDALARLAEADKVAKKTPFESNLIRHLRAAAAIGSKDVAAAAEAVTAVTEAKALPAADQLQLIQAVAGLAFAAKDYATTIVWAGKLVQAQGGADPQTRTLLIQSRYLSGDFAGAAKEQQTEIAEYERAGKPVLEPQLQLLANVQAREGDNGGYLATLERLTASFPKPAYWSDLIQRVTAPPGFSSRLRLDLLRFRLTVGLLQAPADYVELIEGTWRAGAAGEAKAVLEQGFAAGILGQGAEGARHRRLATAVTQAAAEEAAALPAKEAEAIAGPSLALVAGGWFGQGQAAKAAGLFERALTAGGLKAPEDIRLRLGVSLVAAGENDKAIQVFQAVQGEDGASALARLWLIRARRS